jgi:hypothetical protein
MSQRADLIKHCRDLHNEEQTKKLYEAMKKY